MTRGTATGWNAIGVIPGCTLVMSDSRETTSPAPTGAARTGLRTRARRRRRRDRSAPPQWQAADYRQSNGQASARSRDAERDIVSSAIQADELIEDGRVDDHFGRQIGQWHIATENVPRDVLHRTTGVGQDDERGPRRRVERQRRGAACAGTVVDRDLSRTAA